MLQTGGGRWLEQVARWEELVVKGNEAEDAGVGKVYNPFRPNVEYIGQCWKQTAGMECSAAQVYVTVLHTHVNEEIKYIPINNIAAVVNMRISAIQGKHTLFSNQVQVMNCFPAYIDPLLTESKVCHHK